MCGLPKQSMRSMTVPPKKKTKEINMSFADFRISKITFDVIPTEKDKKKTQVKKYYDFEILTTYAYTKENRELISYVIARQKTKNAPFFIEVQGAGRFIFEKNPDEKILHQMSNVNCPSIIFPYIRETIADITRRAGFPPVHLHPVNFMKPPQHPSLLSPKSAKLESLTKTNKTQ